MLVFCLFGHRKIDERQQVVFVGKWDKLSILFIGNKWRETNCCMNLARRSDLVPQSPAFSACLCWFTRVFFYFLNFFLDMPDANYSGKSLEIWILKHSKYVKYLIQKSTKYHFWDVSTIVQIYLFFGLHVLHSYSRKSNVDHKIHVFESSPRNYQQFSFHSFISIKWNDIKFSFPFSPNQKLFFWEEQ